MKKLRVVFIFFLFLFATPLLALAADDVASSDSSPAVTAPDSANSSDSAVVVPQAPTPSVTETSTVGKGLPERVETLNAAVTAETQQVDDMQIQLDELQQKVTQLRKEAVKQNIAVIALALLVLILGTILFAKRRKKPVATVVEQPASAKTEKVVDDTQSEYDFMGSSEGIPAKLDLARAYIAMEDYVAARESLTAIVKEGSDEQRREANALLNKINI